MANSEAAVKLKRARAALVLDEPFFGALVLRLVPVEDLSADTLWTDGRRLGYSPAFVLGEPFKRLVGSLVHEVLHCALCHHVRRGARDPGRWNMAGDYAVNPLVVPKFELPDGVLLSNEFKGLHAEAIYNRLQDEDKPKDQGEDGKSGPDGEADEDDGPEDDGEGSGDEGGESEAGGDEDEGPGDGSGSGSSDGRGDDAGESGLGDPGGCGEVRDCPAEDGGPAGEAERAEAEADWRVAVAQAAAQAQSMGKLPAGLERFVDEIVNPAVDWRSVLQRFIQSVAKSDYSWVRPDRRFIHAGIYLPSCSNLELGPVVVGVDSSGSIGQAGLDAAAAEVSAICQDLRAEVWAVYCDAAVQGVDHFMPEDLPFKLNPKGGGGTDFRPVFEWVESEGVRPSCLVFFTDLCGTFPAAAPDYPVLWVVFGSARSPWDRRLRESVPFGEVVEVQDF